MKVLRLTLMFVVVLALSLTFATALSAYGDDAPPFQIGLIYMIDEAEFAETPRPVVQTSPVQTMAYSQHLPLIMGGSKYYKGIHGRVTSTSEEKLQVWRWRSGRWSLLMYVTTVNGEYDVVIPQPVYPTDYYFVAFVSGVNNTQKMGLCFGKTFHDYFGGPYRGGDFNTLGLQLGEPADKYSSTLPITFTWTPRLGISETHKLTIFDVYYADVWEIPASATGHILEVLPSGVFTNSTYIRWGVRVFDHSGVWCEAREQRDIVFLP